MRKQWLYLTLFFASLLLLSACGGAQAAPPGQAGESNPEVRTITVNGVGTVSITPDIARIFIGVQSEAEEAASAVADNNRQTQAVFDTLQDAGIADEDIRTTNFSVFPRQERDRDGNLKSITYVVQNTVNVTVRDVDKIGQVLDAVVQAGANNISGIQFDLADRSQATTEALEAAVQDARARADILAQAAGVSLGAVQSINTFSSAPIFPVKRASAEFGVGGEVPVQPGELEITMQVTVVYEIQ